MGGCFHLKGKAVLLKQGIQLRACFVELFLLLLKVVAVG